MTRLIDNYDAALFDLDGVIYLGPHAIDGVADSLTELRRLNTRIGFVTNNAARTPAAVADHLVELGIEATETDVVNSTQATIRMLQKDLEPGTKILTLGTDALAEQLADAGFDPVRTLEDSPAVVVQGYHPAVAWSLLELGAIAIQQGATWYATNPDMTRPTERGLLPGCGSQVAVVQACVEQEPRVAGKPFRPLLDETVLRLQAKHPIFVGDRIDTDIMGANAVGMDSLFVFTGAHGKHDLATAGPDGRPTHISWGTEGLLSEPRAAQITADGGSCQGQAITVSEGVAHAASIPAGRAEQLDLLWVALQLAWDHEIQITGILESLDELP